MANDKRFVAKNGLDNNNLRITNVATPAAASDAATMGFSSNADNLTAGVVPVARLSGSYNINISGNAATATALQTARTISLTGDVTGSVSFNGTANASISTTIAPDSVALGTDTTGNYVATASATGNGISGTATGEGSTFTVSSNATAANTASTIVFRDAGGNFSAGTITASLNGNATSANTATSATSATTATNVSGGTASVTTLTASGAANLNGGTSTTTLTASDAANLNGGLSTTSISTTGNVTVGGNLIVNGTTTTVNSTTVTIDDPVFTLGGDTAPTADDNKDRGIEFRWHDGTAARTGFFGFDDSTGFFTFIPIATNTSEVFTGTLGVIDAARITGSAATWTTPRNLTISGDATATFTSVNGSANVNAALTLATVNANTGTFGSASAIPVVTVNAKGLVTAVTTAAIQTGTNITDSNANATTYLTFTTATSGSVSSLNVDSSTTPLTYNPSTNVIAASISGNAATATTANTATSVSGGTASVTTLSTSGNATLGSGAGNSHTVNGSVTVTTALSTSAGANIVSGGAVRARGGAPGAAGVNNNGFSFTGNSGDNDSGMFSSADGQIDFYSDSVIASRISSGGNFFRVVPGGSTLYPDLPVRAFVLFNAVSPPSIIKSSGVDTITRGGTGQYTLNLTTPAPNNQILVAGSAPAAGNFSVMVATNNGALPSTTAVPIMVITGSNNLTDRNYVAVYIMY